MKSISHRGFLTPPQGEGGAVIEARLKKILREDQVSPLWTDRLSYGRDCNSKAMLWVRSGEIRYPPQWVVWPENTHEVSAILSLASHLRVPVIPFGGGSGVCGGTWALKGGICLDLKRMDAILEMDTRKMQVRVQSGMNGEWFERALNRRGLTLGHFPSSIYAATVGGYLACRSAGQFSSLYGKIEDMVEGLEVVLADGQILRLGNVREQPQTLDLKEIFIGSEGTLGVMTEGSFRVHPLPQMEAYRGFYFSNVGKGIQAAKEIMQRGLKPSVLRLYDPLDTLLTTSHEDKEEEGNWLDPLFSWFKEQSLKPLLRNPKLLKNLTDFLPARCLMILGFQGLKALVPGKVSRAQEICKKYRGKDLGEGPGLHWLKHRYSVSYKLSPLFDEGFFADTLEVATTWSNVLKLYRKVREVIGKHALVLAHFSHAYPEGCSIYFTFVGYRNNLHESEKIYDVIWRDGLEACVAAGGTISHHHGVGILKAEFMSREWGEGFDWLYKLKRELDPGNILNPGKLGFPLVWEEERT